MNDIQVFYDSKSGLGKRFAERVRDTAQPVSEVPTAACILVTRNVGLGKIPRTTKRFLARYGDLVRGVVVNGDRRFGKYYCAAGPKIRDEFGIPVLRNIERDGNDEDVLVVRALLEEMG